MPFLSLLLLAALGGADARPRLREGKLEVTLALAEKDGKWVFSITGRTDLPAATVLQARVVVPEEVIDPVHGRQEDDEESLVADDDAQPPSRTFKAGVGWFHLELCSFARKPYAIRYRARVDYLPDDQPPAVSLVVGDVKRTWRGDLRVGSDEEYNRQLRERLDELGRDLMQLQRINGEMEERVPLARAGAAAWSAWKQASQDRMAELLDRNRRRFAIWAVWPERRGRMGIGGLCYLLDRTLVAVEERQDDQPLRGRFEDFEGELDELLTGLRIDAPLNLKKAVPAVAAYDKAVARIGTAPPERRREVRAEAFAALFDLLPSVKTRRRGYVYLNDIGVRLVELFKRMDAGATAGEIAEARVAHADALAAFKKFAGIP